jgi:hypothetical protein
MEIADHAAGARTVEEPATEIEHLRQLETLAQVVTILQHDAKGSQLAAILDDLSTIDEQGNRRERSSEFERE